jgi:integrase
MWFAMRAACEEAGVEPCNAGVLRHSVATWLHEAGVPLSAISEQLGHRDPRTTADFYRDMGGQARVLALPKLTVVR